MKSVEAILLCWSKLQEFEKLEIYYEDLVRNPEKTLRDVIAFIGCKFGNDFMNSITVIKSDNFNKWKRTLSAGEIEEIKAILSPFLEELGYLKNRPW